MRYEVGGHVPRVDPTAVVAPTAVLSGDVTMAAGAHVSFGAVVIGEDAPVVIGRDTIVRENVVIRSSPGHPVSIAEHVLVGAHSALYGCQVGEGAFLATGVRIFHGATVEPGAEVRINGVVHVNFRVLAGATVPIGWVAVGDPATILPPEAHDDIWAIQRHLGFPETVYGVDREPDGTIDMRRVTSRGVDRGRADWRRVD